VPESSTMRARIESGLPFGSAVHAHTIRPSSSSATSTSSSVQSAGSLIRFAFPASDPSGAMRCPHTPLPPPRAQATNQPRSFDYPFTVIELHLNRDGEGEGKMSIATKVIYDKKENMVTLENYQTSPVLLTNVKREKVTH